MTREERKRQKEEKERLLIESLRGKVIDGKGKSDFRTTSIWKGFRKWIRELRKVDALTGRKLAKTFNCHHIRFDPRLYTDLDEKYFLALNSQMHDWLHIAVSETIKNPDFMKKAAELVELHIRLNEGRDVRDWVRLLQAEDSE